MQRADLDWKNLNFCYRDTDHNIRYTWKDGQWDTGVVSKEQHLPIHMAATCLHYGQEAFEGLKAYEQKDGKIVVFRDIENARRMNKSCSTIYMPQVPEPMFQEAIDRVIHANLRFVPPYGTGASLYIRPVVIGTGPKVGVSPADEYMFIVFATPVGPYFKSGFKPVRLVIEEYYDRAAPYGVGSVKVGGNYAAGLRASLKAKGLGYTEALYLDAREKKYLDESGPANFFGITQDGCYVTPDSETILPSITNMSLIDIASDLGMKPQRRKIPVEEIFSFVDAGCCGTAAVITPVKSITWREKVITYCEEDIAGKYCTELYQRLVDIQLGISEDKFNWMRVVSSADEKK